VVTDDDQADTSRFVDAADSEHHYRTLLANERTFLGWQGMALSLLVASIAVQSFTAASTSAVWCVLAVALAVAAVAAALHGLFRWRHVDRALRSGTPSPLGSSEHPRVRC
jgi:putative membrane protein